MIKLQINSIKNETETTILLLMYNTVQKFGVSQT